MKPRRDLSSTGRIDLGALVKHLQGLRTPVSSIHSVKRRPLLELFAEEAKLLRDGGVKPSAVVCVLMSHLGLPLEEPLGRAALLSSMKAEESVDALDYHNHHHVVEVIAAAYILGRREKLPIESIGELVVAATGHDLGHTGQLNRYHYERESYSCQILRLILDEVGLPSTSIQRIEQMILATDFDVGVPQTRQSYLDTRSLAPTDEKRLLAAQCQLLIEADVLFSCFDLSYNEFLSKLLSAELKRAEPNLSLVERIKFLSSVLFISDAAAQLGLEYRRLKLLEELQRIHNENMD